MERKHQKAYQYLYAALVKYNNAVDSKDVLDAYAQGNTNYKYLYVDTKTKKVYSNIKSVTFSNYKKIMTDIVDSNEAFMVIEPKQQDCMVGMENTFGLNAGILAANDRKFWPCRRKLYLLYFSGFCVFLYWTMLHRRKHITINLNHGSCHCSF